jgi:hypothetical protein
VQVAREQGGVTSAALLQSELLTALIKGNAEVHKVGVMSTKVDKEHLHDWTI